MNASLLAELERQVEALRVSHLAMIRTVGEMGGISKLLKLYEGFREVRAELDRLSVLPHGEVRPFELGAALGHDVSHSSAHAPEMKPEPKQEQAVTPQREIAPQQEQSLDIGLGL